MIAISNSVFLFLFATAWKVGIKQYISPVIKEKHDVKTASLGVMAMVQQIPCQ